MLEVFVALVPMWQANPLPKWSRLPDRELDFLDLQEVKFNWSLTTKD